MTQSIEQVPQQANALPRVDDAVLADMSGPLARSQDELWAAVANAQVGQLPAWTLSEASRVERTGVGSRDAFIQGVGYAVAALLQQLARDSSKKTVEELFATFYETADPQP